MSGVLTLARFFLPLTEPGKGLEDGFFLCARVGTSEFGLGIKGRPSLLLASWAVGAWASPLHMEYSGMGLLLAGDWALGHPFLLFSVRSKL